MTPSSTGKFSGENDTPLVSIVIPAHNHARYLDEAVRSVLGQDYPRIELVVLDDGSTDNTRDILAAYTGRFFWETQENMGQAATLNKAWRMAKGEILGYLGADDILMPHAVSSAVASLEARPEIVVAYCDFNLIDPQSRIVRRVETPDFDFNEMVARLACPPGPGAFFRRAAAEGTLWDASLKQMPDYDFWLRLGLKGKFLRIPRVLAAFRVHEASQTFAPADCVRAEEPIVILSRFFANAGLPPDVAALKQQALSNAHLVSAQLHFRAGRIRKGLNCMMCARQLRWRNLMTWNAVRIVLNALLNRIGHRMLWGVRALFDKRNN